jgi:hypothetical protein
MASKSKKAIAESISLDEMIGGLAEAASLDMSELGEWWNGLTTFAERYGDFKSDRLKKAIENEIRNEFIRLKTEFRIETKETTYVSKTTRLLHWDES